MSDSVRIIKPNEIPPERRDLFLRVADGEGRAYPYLHGISGLIRIDEVLRWLVRNQITGKKFVYFVEDDCQRSLLKLSAYILKRINHDLYEKPIFHGKDIL